MKKLMCLFCLVFFIGCRERQVPEPAIETVYIQEPQKIRKFVFVVFEVEEPILHHVESSWDINYTKLSDPISYIEWQELKYCSDIEEFDDFTEDVGYLFMDNMEKKIIKQPHTFVTDVMLKVRNQSDSKSLLSEGVTKIKKRYYLGFDNYKDASLKRREYLKY